MLMRGGKLQFSPTQWKRHLGSQPNIINNSVRRPYSPIVSDDHVDMILSWLFLHTVTIATCHKLTERIEDTELDTNVTILYPIANKTDKYDTNTTNKDTKINHDSTTWKIEAAFAESKVEEKEENGTRTVNDEKNEIDNNSVTNKAENDTDYNKMEDKARNLTEPSTTEAAVNKSSVFKPSPHLGDFFDSIDTIEVVPTYKTFGSFTPVVKKPAAGFISSPQDYHATFKNIPKHIFSTHKEFPYKFDSNTYVKPKDPWKPAEGLDSRPTVAIPVRVPAGGFYKSPDAFKDKPSYYSEDENFGMELHGDVNDSPLEKRPNPWKSLLRLVTAFIPLGLIISALTPNIITVQNTPDNNYPPHLYRRSDEGTAHAPISERCRRRLLCELHAENNYIKSSPSHNYGKQCYKIHCEDTNALYRMLRWLFSYHQGADDQRGRHFT